MSALVFILLLSILLLGLGLREVYWKAPSTMPERLRRKADALTYETLATAYAQRAREDARYADLAGKKIGGRWFMHRNDFSSLIAPPSSEGQHAA